MSDTVLLGLFTMLTAIIAPCLVLIVKRLTAVHTLVNSKMTRALKEIESLKAELRVFRSARKGKPPK